MNRRVVAAPDKSSTDVAPRAASAARHATPRVGLRQWLLLHQRASADALSRLRGRKLASAMGLLLAGLALALPLMLATLTRNLDQLVGGLRSSGEIAVFLQPGLNAAQAQKQATELRARADVATVEVRSPAQGLRELRSIPGLDEAITAAGANPLPYLLLVRPRDENSAAQLAAAFAAMPEVDQVQHDQQWRDRLRRMLELLHRLAVASFVLFGLAAMLVVANHVRVEVEMRREEIGIIKLLGAGDGFVRRPFLWSGFWLGACSALLAVAITQLVRGYFAASVRALAASYESDLTVHGPDAAMMLTTLACGVLLGSFGAYLASSLQLAYHRAS